ncbi:amidase family protein [Siccirubricoccus sp. KC 17139]|uniref:Amidase family protein n=1 Tax=Siccirubricoccus soli TaxID=2899147 RepID=A0ABT1D8P7_9PROT|nr:amidase family protein [Siccirubricoccus soli]MCO6418311.1 amidase family protein [Siccirubricoccus soli]MCP2684446.1 amidase family protein [Siccirubricoccus soli]
MTDLWRLSATDLAARIRARETSAQEATKAALARLEAVNPALNAVIAHDPKQALAAAAAVDAALSRGEDPGPLAGVPVTVKVNVDQEGWATTNGLRLQQDLIARQDSPVVANLKRAGAVILGRTNTPAFSLRWFTRNSLHGATKNPRDPGLTPGGSSGGAAAAVAAGIGAIGHGTDIGGSIRYPAYACGVHGLRPTLGRIPAWNASGPDRGIGAQLMAVSGPIARSIADLRLGLAAMAQQDLRDPWWTPAPLEGPAFPKRAALCLAPDGMKVQPEVAAALRDAAARLEKAGWAVEEVANTPPLVECARLQALLWLAESRRPGPSVFEAEGDPDAIAVSGFMARLCPEASLADFQAALQARVGLLRQWLAFLGKYPAVVMPVSGELPFRDHDDVTSFERFEEIVMAQLPQVGLPLLSLPGLTVSTGLVGRAPVGVQIVGSRYREDVLLAAGEAIEAGGVPPAPIDPVG